MALGRVAVLAAKAAKKALANRKANLGTIRTSRADPRVESARAAQNLPRNTSLAKTTGTQLATTGGTLAKTAGTRVGSARPIRNVTPRASSTRRDRLTDAAALAGLGAILTGAYLGNKPKKVNTKPTKPTGGPAITKPKKSISTGSSPKMSSKSGASTTKPTTKPKPKMASVPIVRNRRLPTVGPKTSVPVGSSIIRNKDGSIKKVKPPSGKKPKNKFARMTQSQINRLSGKERIAYNKYKRSLK